MKPRKDFNEEGAGSGCMTRLVRLLCSWWTHRKAFKEFDIAVENAIKKDSILLELKKARRVRINEIIIEVGERKQQS